jgi:hypothetical protein
MSHIGVGYTPPKFYLGFLNLISTNVLVWTFEIKCQPKSFLTTECPASYMCEIFIRCPLVYVLIIIKYNLLL